VANHERRTDGAVSMVTTKFPLRIHLTWLFSNRFECDLLAAWASNESMSEKIELTCKHCNRAFVAFLSEMAEHNRKITCPSCGKVNEYSPVELDERGGTKAGPSKIRKRGKGQG
jgi:hypothetical protein